MPPPPSYLDITPVPYTRVVTQAEFNGGTFGGVANEVWFRRVVTETELLGNFTNNGGTFLPRIVLFESDGSTTIKTITPSGSASHAWYHLLEPGTYYIRIRRDGGGASDFDFTVDYDTRTEIDAGEFHRGDIIIQDQRAGYPAFIIGTDGTIRGFVSTIPGGQTGAILPNNYSLWHDITGSYSPSDRLHLFDDQLTYVMSIDAGLTANQAAPMSNSATDFYVVDQITRAVSKVSTAGVVTSLGTLGGSAQVAAIGVNADGTILYWTQESGAGSDKIHRYDLVGMTDLSDLYTIAGFSVGNDSIARTDNLHPGDIIVLPDEAIVTWWYDASADQYTILHISDAGVLLHSHALVATDQRMDHLAYVKDSTTQVEIWFFIDEFDTTARGGVMNLASGTISPTFDTPVSDFGINLADDDATMFTPSVSCTVLRFAIDSGGGGVVPRGNIGPIAWLDTSRVQP